MNWNISVACSRLSVSEDQPNSKWTTNDGCGCRGSDLQTECLLTLSVSLFVFFNFFSPVPRRFFELLFSSRFPWMWPWFITDLWLCVGEFPVTARNSTKIGMQAKSSLWMGLMSICPARESCFFFILGFKISFNKKKPPENIFIYVFQRRAQMIFSFFHYF